MGWRDLFNTGDEPADETTVSVPDALRLLADGGVVIDVRTQTEYERGHLPGARLVAITDLTTSPTDAVWGHDPLAMLDPATQDKAVIVVSSTPAHARAVAHLLRDRRIPTPTRWPAAWRAGCGTVRCCCRGRRAEPGPPAASLRQSRTTQVSLATASPRTCASPALHSPSCHGRFPRPPSPKEVEFAYA